MGEFPRADRSHRRRTHAIQPVPASRRRKLFKQIFKQLFSRRHGIESCLLVARYEFLHPSHPRLRSDRAMVERFYEAEGEDQFLSLSLDMPSSERFIHRMNIGEDLNWHPKSWFIATVRMLLPQRLGQPTVRDGEIHQRPLQHVSHPWQRHRRRPPRPGTSHDLPDKEKLGTRHQLYRPPRLPHHRPTSNAQCRL